MTTFISTPLHTPKNSLVTTAFHSILWENIIFLRLTIILESSRNKLNRLAFLWLITGSFFWAYGEPNACNLLLGHLEGEWTYVSKLSYASPSFLKDHLIKRTPILAGAASIDNLVLGAMILHQQPVVEYTRVIFGKKLEFCKDDSCRTVETAIAAEPGKTSTISSINGDIKSKLSSAKFKGAYAQMPEGSLEQSPAALTGKVETVNKSEAYQQIHSLGLNVGFEHQRIVEVKVQGNKADVLLDASGIDFDQFANYPGLLDSLFQAGAVIRHQNNLDDSVLHIPAAIKRLIIRKIQKPISENTRFTGRIEITQGMEKDAKLMVMNVVMFQDGVPLVVAEGFKLAGVSADKISEGSE